MADQTIALQLNIDTNAPDAIDQVKAKIAELEESVNGATESTGDLVQKQKQLGDAKDLLAQLSSSMTDVGTATEQAAQSQQVHNQSITEGKERFREYRSEMRGGMGNLLNLTRGTAEYNAELKRIGEHRAQFRLLQQDMAGVNPSITEGKERFREYRSEMRGGMGNLLNLTRGTAEYNAELKRIGEHRAQFRLLQQDMAGVNPHEAAENMARFGDTGIKAMRGIGGAAALAAGSNEALEATIFKVEAATEVLQGVQGLVNIKRQASIFLINMETAAQELLNAATAAWPVTLVIAAVAALVIVLARWNSANEELAESEQKKIDKLEEVKKAIKDEHDIAHNAMQNELELLEAQDASYDKIKAQREALRKLDIQNMETQIANQMRIIAAQQIKNKALDDEQHIVSDIWSMTLQQFGINNGYNEKRLAEIEERKKKLTEERNELEKLVNDYNHLTIVDPAVDEQKDKKRAEDRVKKAKEARDKRIADDEKAHKEEQDRMLADLEGTQDAVERQKTNIAASDKREAIAAQQEKVRQMKENGEAQLAIMNQEMLLEIQQAGDDKQKLFDIDQKYEKQRLALEKQASAQAIQNAKEEADKKTAIRKAEFDIAKNLGDAMASIGDLLLKKGKQQTDGTKAIALVQLGIKEAEAIANVVVSATDPDSPANIATGGAAAIANIAAGIAGVAATFVQAKSILNSGSGSVSAPSSSTSYNAPTVGSSTQFGANPATNSQGVTDYGYNAMSKTYISQTDLNAAQSVAFYQNLNRSKK